jgi:hypothetical protein
MQEVIFQMFLIKSTTDLSKGILEWIFEMQYISSKFYFMSFSCMEKEIYCV